MPTNNLSAPAFVSMRLADLERMRELIAEIENPLVRFTVDAEEMRRRAGAARRQALNELRETVERVMPSAVPNLDR